MYDPGLQTHTHIQNNPTNEKAVTNLTKLGNSKSFPKMVHFLVTVLCYLNVAWYESPSPQQTGILTSAMKGIRQEFLVAFFLPSLAVTSFLLTLPWASRRTVLGYHKWQAGKWGLIERADNFYSNLSKKNPPSHFTWAESVSEVPVHTKSYPRNTQHFKPPKSKVSQSSSHDFQVLDKTTMTSCFPVYFFRSPLPVLVCCSGGTRSIFETH